MEKIKLSHDKFPFEAEEEENYLSLDQRKKRPTWVIKDLLRSTQTIIKDEIRTLYSASVAS